DGRAGRRRRGDRPGARSHARAGDDAVRDSALRVPGADARRGQGGAPAANPSHRGEMGAHGYADRARDGRRRVPGHLEATGGAGVIRVRDAAFGIAVTTDGNARYVLLDPFEGGKAAVAEAARNIACTGARPLGITNCLNFGSPERPAVFYQFREACRGIADACRALDTPVTGGNVSFYNESPTGAVDPTPVIG